MGAHYQKLNNDKLHISEDYLSTVGVIFSRMDPSPSTGLSDSLNSVVRIKMSKNHMLLPFKLTRSQLNEHFNIYERF